MWPRLTLSPGLFPRPTARRSTSTSSAVCEHLDGASFRIELSEYPFVNIADIRSIEGVLVAKKDFNLPKHGDIDTKNLYVRLPDAAFARPQLIELFDLTYMEINR